MITFKKNIGGMRFWIMIVLVCGGLISASAQTYELRLLSINSGGETEQSSTDYGARLTLAQTVAGYSESSNHRAYLGFWQVVSMEPGHDCGDANSSGYVDIDDIFFVANYIFTGGPEPVPLESADTNCSGFIDIDDIIYLIYYAFTGGPVPCDPNDDGVPDC